MAISIKTIWPSSKIRDLCDVSRGSSPRPIADQRYFEGGHIPWIKIADATKSGKFLYKTKEYVNDYGASFSRFLPVGTIIVAASGTLGYTQILGVPGCAHDGWLILTNLRNFDRDYAYYVLQQMQRHFYNSAYGAAIQNINTEILRETEIPAPPLPTQRKIAAILSAYDDLIENNLRRIKILEEMAQNLYDEWFVKFRFPGYQNARFIDSSLGRIPEGWAVKALGELVNTQYGYTESAQEKPVGPKYLRGMDINKTTYIDWEAVPFCPIPDDLLPKYQLAEGDIVIIRMADPGKVGIVEKDVNAVFASYLVRISRKSNRIRPYYLFHFLIAERYQGYITGASTGTTRKSASAGVLIGVDILIPPEAILADFESQVQTFRRFLNNLIERNTTLRRTRDLLLPRLISGEVNVSELDIAVTDET